MNQVNTNIPAHLNPVATAPSTLPVARVSSSGHHTTTAHTWLSVAVRLETKQTIKSSKNTLYNLIEA